MTLPKTLRFGIQSLDKLIGTTKDGNEAIYGIDLTRLRNPNGGKANALKRHSMTSSICLTGPDGTGKSVFSLHLASHYLADCNSKKETGKNNNGSCPRVLYISTDLNYNIALKGWSDFALDTPFERREPLVEVKEGIKQWKRKSIKVELKQYFPTEDRRSEKSVVKYLESPNGASSSPGSQEVCFVDLASRTAGDDWGFVHRLLSILKKPRPDDPRHLVVLDAIEGFETLVGDLNAFGEKSSRRSRIAQVMRLAAEKCHLLLVVEEARDQRFPEEFVTDVVIRLRNVETGKYLRRTVEIEKARGQWHRRGQHPYVIRDGLGSTTGTQRNADDPLVQRNNSQEKHPPVKGKNSKEQHQSYVHVFPSLDYTSREIMIDRGNPRKVHNKSRHAAFGIPFLDNMLGGTGEKAKRSGEGSDTRGLPCGEATALLGDSLTQKSQLGKAFLSRAFYTHAEELWKAAIRLGKKSAPGQKIIERSQRIAYRPRSWDPVTLLFTTQDLNDERLAAELYQWLRDDDDICGQDDVSKKIDKEVEKAYRAALTNHIKDHTICRRFEIHDLSAPILMNIFRSSIETAQRKMFRMKTNEPLPPVSKRFAESWRIRVVIDDLNSFRNIYAEVHDDPLLLPSLLFMLNREGITSLIIDSQSSGSPELSITERFDSSVRELVQNRIYAWRLPFYGENRVAIGVIPPMSHEYRGLIRELHWETKDESTTNRELTVDPHFELYMGLEKNQPQPVPLEVHLYVDTPSVERYIATEEKLLNEIFTPVLRNNGAHVITPSSVGEYETLRDACHLQRDTKLDHTKILQVNEFWWLRRPKQRQTGAFRPQWDYLNAVTATLTGDEYRSEPVVDPFWVFQPPPNKTSDGGSQKNSRKARPDPKEKKGKHRLDFFDPKCGYHLAGAGKEAQQTIDRVPYTWDFGFLLCNSYAWEEAIKSPTNASGKSHVSEVWNRLRKATTKQRGNEKSSIGPKGVSWREFLGASKTVAEFQSYRTAAPATAFDFTMVIPESFSCVILEMWMSEAYDSLKEYKKRSRGNPVKRKDFADRKKMLEEVGQRQWNLDPTNPVTLLGGLEYEKGQNLTEILQGRRRNKFQSFSLELYKVWLLLTDAINFAELVDSSSHLNFEFRSREVSTHAVSARHWYKTASKFVDSLRPEQLEYNWLPVRLPGHFSVRADWFLAVAAGSRSSRLADHALDLLSSQRSNVTRLQEGIGLPTRILSNTNKPASHLRTRLIAAPEEGQPLTNVEYDLLRQIGAGDKSTEEEFYWLWRSGIWAYNRHSRVWHKWLNRALLWWHAWHQRHESNWKSGFQIYDRLTETEFGESGKARNGYRELEKLDSWNEFDKLRDILIEELEQVSVSTV
jgi:KaiC/GvpD/RAD55 family RecA-like ATPase